LFLVETAGIEPASEIKPHRLLRAQSMFNFRLQELHGRSFVIYHSKISTVARMIKLQCKTLSNDIHLTSKCQTGKRTAALSYAANA